MCGLAGLGCRPKHAWDVVRTMPEGLCLTPILPASVPMEGHHPRGAGWADPPVRGGSGFWPWQTMGCVSEILQGSFAIP